MSAEYYESALSPTANADDIRLAIKALVVDNTPYGWTHVEDYTESGANWSVLKCPASSSGLPNDFHVVVVNNPSLTGTAIYFYVCEGYDATTHRMKRPAYTSGTGTVPSGADGSVGNDSALWRPVIGSAGAVLTSGTGLSNTPVPHRMNFSSPAIVGIAFYADGMNIVLKATSNHALYLGAFQSLVKNAATNDPMPLASLHLANALTQAFTPGGPTRSAMNAGVSANHELILVGWHGDSASSIVNGATSNPTSASTFDKYSPVAGPYLQPLLIFRNTQSGSVSAAGFLRGRAKYVLQSATAVGWGDTVDIGTDRYMYVGLKDGVSHMWIYKGPVPA